jgi:putative spermidine/putrescine transport system permease protein
VSTIAAKYYEQKAHPRMRLPSSAWLLVLPLIFVLALLYVGPIASVLWLSVTDPSPGLGNYERLLFSDALQRVLWSTLRIAALTTLFATLFGYLIAYTMHHTSARHRHWIMAFVLVPFWVSVLVRAFAWLTLLRTEGVINTALMSSGIIASPLDLVRNELGVVIGMVHYMIPYAVLPLYANMQGIDQRILNASRSLGASPRTTFMRVFLPLSAPGIAAAALLVFVLALGFLVTPAILGGGRVVMIAEYVRVQILQTVRWGVGTMMASVLLITVVVLLAAMSRVVDIRKLFGAK